MPRLRLSLVMRHYLIVLFLGLGEGLRPPLPPAHIRGLVRPWSSSTAAETSESTRTQKRDELLDAVRLLDRGFTATAEDRKRITSMLLNLADLNPTANPGAAYFDPELLTTDDLLADAELLKGRWTLVYTDAPDITSLNDNPVSEVGRIGQECDSTARTIKNIIQWRPRSWLRLGPLAEDEVEQRVVLKAKSTPGAPKKVDLFVEGLDLSPKALLGQAWTGEDFELRGPLSGQIPFGTFNVLFLDDVLRVVRTAQGYFAVNVRDNDGAW